MSIYKRGSVYWYHFVFNEQHIQESTKQGNPRVARQIEAAHRTAWLRVRLALVSGRRLEHVAEFCKRVEAYARAQYGRSITQNLAVVPFCLEDDPRGRNCTAQAG